LLPLVLFFPAYIFAEMNGGGWTAHWYVNIFVTADSLIHLVVINIIVGSALYIIFKDFSLSLENDNTIYGFIYSFGFVIFLIAYMHFPISYFKLMFFVLMFFCFKMSNLSLSYLLLLCVAVFELLNNSYRWPIIFFMLIVTAGIRYGVVKSVLIISFGIVLSVIALNPIKHGNFDIQINPLQVVSSVTNHLNPIYMAAEFFYDLDIEGTVVLVEAIPLAKSITGFEGLIKDAENEVALPDGGDFGSSSNSINNYVGYLLLAILVVSVKFLMKVRPLNQVLFFYFLSMGPLFFRRSLLNVMNDIIVITIFTVFFYLLFSFLANNYSKSIVKKC
jgi:hypothetical protein